MNDDSASPNDTQAPRRVLVYGLTSPRMVEMVARLSEERNWKPAYWVGPKPDRASAIRERFPGVETHPKADAVRARFPESVPSGQWPIRDGAVVERLARHDPVLYPVFLRQSRARAGMARLAEYHEHITAWHYFFDWLAPDLVLFDNIPMHVYDYVPYLLCLERDIPALLMLRPMQVPDVIMPTNRYDQPAPRVVARYRELVASGADSDLELEEGWERFLACMSGSYEQAMYRQFADRYRVARGGERVKLRSTVPARIGDIVRRVAKRRPWRNQVRDLLGELWYAPGTWRLRWSYQRRTRQPDYGLPYVFVPLHVQPERTSIPQGGIFGHQLIMIEYLSRALPEGWILYVKEHPVQLYTRRGSKTFRAPSFYRELKRFGNVRLIPSDISARRLIEHSRAVASATSTACWEAIFLRRPALVFGAVFFTFCEGVFHTTTYGDCVRALTTIRDGYRVDPGRLRATLRAMQDESLPMPPEWSPQDCGDEAAWSRWTDRARAHIGRDGRIAQSPEAGRRADIAAGG